MNKKNIVWIKTNLEAIKTCSNHNAIKLINNSFDIQNEELKSIQKAIALLRQDLPKIIHDESVKSSSKT